MFMETSQKTDKQKAGAAYPLTSYDLSLWQHTLHVQTRVKKAWASLSGASARRQGCLQFARRKWTKAWEKEIVLWGSEQALVGVTGTSF